MIEITPEYLASQHLSPTIVERFWRDVFILPYDKGCWLWMGCTSCGWYGMISNNPYGTIRTHVLSFLLNNGEIPKGMCVLHKCHNPICVRPDHLKLGTPADNAADKVLAGRQNRNVPWSRGTLNNHNKLTNQDVLEIRKAYSPSLKNSVSVAKRFGIDRTQVLNIYHRKQWKHI